MQLHPYMKWRLRVVIGCSDSFGHGGQSGRHRPPRKSFPMQDHKVDLQLSCFDVRTGASDVRPSPAGQTCAALRYPLSRREGLLFQFWFCVANSPRAIGRGMNLDLLVEMQDRPSQAPSKGGPAARELVGGKCRFHGFSFDLLAEQAKTGRKCPL